jgi:hypothetical protein
VVKPASSLHDEPGFTRLFTIVVEKWFDPKLQRGKARRSLRKKEKAVILVML